uniref:(northern house mosquito) hypothetical protein n=1 Tax=Culex pipiens TaxID=7175 RepID=A0A8D8FF73_CULPI
MLSASTSRVAKVSSFGTLEVYIAANAVFTDLTSRSQAPPMWGAAGGLKTHRVLVLVNASASWPSSLFISIRSSLFAPTKFVPRSVRISAGAPLRPINRRIACLQDSVVSVCTTSRCTARVVRHVNNATHLLGVLRFTRTAIGPK